MVKPTTIRLILTLAVAYSSDVQKIDINNVFLNGTLDEQVFMEQLDGFIDPNKPQAVCKHKHAMYGLKQAPRAWFDRLHTSFFTLGFCNSVSNTSLFYYNHVGSLLFALVYMDEILITRSKTTEVCGIIPKLDQQFSLKKLRSVTYFLGFEGARQNSLVSSQVHNRCAQKNQHSQFQTVSHSNESKQQTPSS